MVSDYKYPDCLSLEGLRQGKRLDAEQVAALRHDIRTRITMRSNSLWWGMHLHLHQPEEFTLTSLVLRMIEIENAAREIREAMQAELTKEG